MLQFIAKVNDRYTVPECVQMALEGGCRWVQLSVPGMVGDQIREIAAEAIPLAKECGAILTIENHVELAKDLGIHGFLLSDGEMTFGDAREYAGPEAIIGVRCPGAREIIELRNSDVDYVTLPDDMPIDEIAAIVAEVRGQEVFTPIVAYGNYGIDDIPSLIYAGVSGVALGDTITGSGVPEEMTRQILSMLKNKTK